MNETPTPTPLFSPSFNAPEAIWFTSSEAICSDAKLETLWANSNTRPLATASFKASGDIVRLSFPISVLFSMKLVSFRRSNRAKAISDAKSFQSPQFILM